MENFQSDEVGTSAAYSRAHAYNRFIQDLRTQAGTLIGGQSTLGQLYDTQQSGTRDRIIQVHVWTNLAGPSESHLALYFNAANLYLVGFSSRNRHYQFSDSSPGQGVSDPVLRTNLSELYRQANGLRTAPLFQNLGYRGNYPSLDPGNARVNREYRSYQIMGAVNSLIDTAPLLPNALRRDLAFLIGATSEATRFGWIQRRVSAAIGNGGDASDPQNHNPAHLGEFGRQLELRWSDLSRLAHRDLDGSVRNATVTIDNRTYRNINDILGINAGRPGISPILALHGSR
ncbi:hypothetical protein DI272_00285 [Streptomyces sp. Act143]|uniref:ribosome-inactivating family protein n=1 Tax=Streptomyces sp. Act143 TaxID=2200760 RepID=UPI000D6836E0|nr:ribosome-inactivating family protein [Streptomyces sp. Act143]PWI12766.1 hypothetical protein DI272_00285 [Streptomyces sp. Act143]